MFGITKKSPATSFTAEQVSEMVNSRDGKIRELEQQLSNFLNEDQRALQLAAYKNAGPIYKVKISSQKWPSKETQLIITPPDFDKEFEVYSESVMVVNGEYINNRYGIGYYKQEIVPALFILVNGNIVRLLKEDFEIV